MNDISDFWKLEPQAVLKPWGLTHKEAFNNTGIRVGLGELWLASAQTGEGNFASNIAGSQFKKNLAELLIRAADAGEKTFKEFVGKTPYAMMKDNPHRGKTEAWYVRKAQGRVGFASGPRTQKQLEDLRELLTGPGLSAEIENWSEEICELFGLVESVSPGDVFFVPAGTLHTMYGIGENSTLIIDEIQQGYGGSPLPTLSKILLVQNSLLSVQVHPDDETVRRTATGEMSISQDLEANPTVRLYDFGRRPGEYPELGFRLTTTERGLRKVEPLEVATENGAKMKMLVACEEFVKSELTIDGGEVELSPVYDSYRIVHCVEGACTLGADGKNCDLGQGETVFVPAALEANLRISSKCGCRIFDDCVPQLGKLKECLNGYGASREDLRGLVDPPRAETSFGE